MLTAGADLRATGEWIPSRLGPLYRRFDRHKTSQRFKTSRAILIAVGAPFGFAAAKHSDEILSKVASKIIEYFQISTITRFRWLARLQ